MRSVDADYIMSALGIFTDKEHGNEHFLYGIETAKEIVANAPTIGGWISVKDSLPKDSRDVLIHTKDYAITTGCYIRSSGEWWRTGNPCSRYTVTHWMPLPEPPEEEN